MDFSLPANRQPGAPEIVRSFRLVGRDDVLHVRARAGCEHKLAGRHRWRVTGIGEESRPFGIDRFDLPLRVRHHRDQRSGHGAAGAETALGDHRGARRDVFAERGKAREVIGANRIGVGVVLVEADAVGEVGAERFEVLPHALQDVIRFAPHARLAVIGKSGRARDGPGDAGLEVKALMPVEEHERARLDRVSVIDGAADQVLGAAHGDGGARAGRRRRCRRLRERCVRREHRGHAGRRRAAQECPPFQARRPVPIGHDVLLLKGIFEAALDFARLGRPVTQVLLAFLHE